MKIRTLDDLKQIEEKGVRLLYPERIKIMVGMGTCGLSTGAGEVFEVISEEVKTQKLDWVVSPTGCIGFLVVPRGLLDFGSHHLSVVTNSLYCGSVGTQ